MPNHITNVIQFDCTPDEFEKIAESIRVEGDFLGSVDFNTLIPMPPELDIEAGSRGERGLQEYKEYLNEMKGAKTDADKQKVEMKYADTKTYDPQMMELGKQYYENIEKYGSPHWYDWCTEHWGTKWNAYDCSEVVSDDRELCFHTAWSAVPEILQKLSEKYPEVSMQYRWADEDIGFNVGEASFKNGRIAEFHVPEPGSRTAFEMSADIMHVELSDFGLFPSEDGQSYAYMPDGPKKNGRSGPEH